MREQYIQKHILQASSNSRTTEPRDTAMYIYLVTV